MLKRKLILVLLMQIISISIFAQNFDLIVTQKGDSIACYIENSSENSVDFKMMDNYNWIKKTLKKEEVKVLKKDAFKGFSIVFKEGTSYIIKTVKNKQINSVKDIDKNSVYAELGGSSGGMTLNYDRIFPIRNSSAIVTRVGFGITSIVALAEINYIYGGPRHYIEAGIGASSNFKSNFSNFRLGYRFHAYNGLVVRLSPLFVYNISDNDNPIDISFGLSLGYSF